MSVLIISTHHQLAGGRSSLGDGLDGFGGLDLSDDNDVHGYLFSAHFSVYGWFFGKSEVKTASKYMYKNKPVKFRLLENNFRSKQVLTEERIRTKKSVLCRNRG